MSRLWYPSVRHIDKREEHNRGECDYGLDPKEGFDCSGLIVASLKDQGITLPQNLRHSMEMFENLGVRVPLKERQSGDLVFFSKVGFGASHVGIMVSEDEYVHAQGKPESFVVMDLLFYTSIVRRKQFRNPQKFFYNPIGFKRVTRM